MNKEISVSRSRTCKPRPKDSELGFGAHFTDHIFLMDYQPERGWHHPRIEPYRSLVLDPAAAALHYGQLLFEGLKAFKGKDGTIRAFRPDKHAARMNKGARRICIPEVDPAIVVKSQLALIDVDREWVPSTIGTALYVRTVIIASEPLLGVRPANAYTYFIIMAPVGAYFPEGLNPVKIKVVTDHVRAFPGGLGEVKTGGNYAGGLYASEAAKNEGFTQVLWLDGVHRKYIEECGNTNVMLHIGDEVVTPPLSGTIMPGVTRDSALTLLRDWGLKVSERPVSMDEVLAAAANGTLREAWSTGTAAVIAPVGELSYRDEALTINGGRTGEVTQRLYDAIVGIQYGLAPDPYGWTVQVGG